MHTTLGLADYPTNFSAHSSKVMFPCEGLSAQLSNMVFEDPLGWVRLGGKGVEGPPTTLKARHHPKKPHIKDGNTRRSTKAIKGTGGHCHNLSVRARPSKDTYGEVGGKIGCKATRNLWHP